MLFNDAVLDTSHLGHTSLQYACFFTLLMHRLSGLAFLTFPHAAEKQLNAAVLTENVKCHRLTAIVPSF